MVQSCARQPFQLQESRLKKLSCWITLIRGTANVTLYRSKCRSFPDKTKPRGYYLIKVVTVIGARPQFVKCAPVSKRLRTVAREVLIHTGQHYDRNLSDTFFDQLGIPAPDYQLNVGSGPHGQQTGEMLARIEPVLVREKPESVIVYGDTNSALAGALAAAKLNIPVIHIEAGLRSFNREMPEEVNRVVIDHISALLFCPTDTAVRNLATEGITSGVFLVGDVMYDALLQNIEAADHTSTILSKLDLEKHRYVLVTVHRQENTEDISNLCNIVDALGRIAEAGSVVVFPVHPRTRAKLHGLWGPCALNIRIIDPVPYLDMLQLEKHAEVILTDSGGVQREAFWLDVPCVTLREETEWLETVKSGRNRIVGTDPARIVAAVEELWPVRTNLTLRDTPGASDRIVEHVLKMHDRTTPTCVEMNRC